MRLWTRLLSLLLVLVSVAPKFASAQAATVTVPPIDFSGVLFGNFQWRTDDAAKLQTGGKPLSKFDVGRAYLTFRMQAGERGSIRVTTDIFNQTPSTYYNGWTVRLKYGYFQYDFTKNLFGVQNLGAVGRIGMLHTVVIEHIEGFWPRFLGNSADETYFNWSSADVGAATLVSLPKKRGEIYVTAVNGSNYSSGETDRFKDFAARVTLTPFANDSNFLRTLTISPWYSKGWTASAFAAGGPAQVGPVPDGLTRDRRGIFVGLKERRLTGGAEFSQRVDDVEAGANTVAIPRTVTGRTGNLLSTFALVRPMEIANSAKRSPWGVLGRIDSFKLNNDQPAGAANPKTNFVIAGLFYDVNTRATFALDYQEAKVETATSNFPTKTLFMHWNVNF